MNTTHIVQRKLHDKLIHYYMMKTNVTVDVATSFLYKTRTMQALLDEKTEFCGKSINEIVYLLELELAGNMYEWRMQAIL